ncbi:MAG: AAA family ATPase [archaeon]|nr:AAA family ATPase [archaeon]
MNLEIEEIRQNTPEYMLAVIIFEEYINGLKKQNSEEYYKTVPTSITKLLATCTARRMSWKSDEKKRTSWWRTFLENVRSVRADGTFTGGDNDKINTCIEYYLDNETREEAKKIAYLAFYKDAELENRNKILQMMNCVSIEDRIIAEKIISTEGMDFPSYTDINDPDLEEAQNSKSSNADFALELSEKFPDRWDGDTFEICSQSWAEFISSSYISNSYGNLYSIKTNFVLPHNRIVYGAPGTGKSYRLEEEKKSISGEIHRVTFHPEYGYADFIGVFRPNPVFSKDQKEFTYNNGAQVKPTGSPHIIYEFVPGAFIKILKRAYESIEKNDGLNHLLIIEEINRSNVSATFGEFFQLLDRDENGNSVYGIKPNDEILQYLSSNGKVSLIEIKIPGNLFLWATMNTTDDGVYSMDSAFKRRWSFEHVAIDEGQEFILDYALPQTIKWLTGFSWNSLRLSINDCLRSQVGQFREDQLLGPFFFKKNELSNSMLFKNKLLDYLHQHLLRHNPSILFNDEYTSASYSKLNKDFDLKNVFKNGILPEMEDEEE